MTRSMSGDEDNQRAVRRLEETVLDREYRRFNLINRNDEVAILELFRVFGDAVRGVIHDPGPATERQRQHLMDEQAAALGHCFKWIAEESEHTILPADPSPRTIVQEALALLEWGGYYHELYLDHVAFWRKEKVAAVDYERRTVEIRYRAPFDPFFLITQRVDELELVTSYYNAMPLEELQAEYRSWASLRGGTIIRRFDGLPCIRPGDPAYELAARWATETIWPELSPETSLDGFSLDDFRRVFAGLVINCAFIAWAEDLQDSRRGVGQGRRSRVVALPHEQMIEWLGDMGGIAAAASQEILDVLTLDTTKNLPSLSYQPFVRSKAGKVYLLPRFIVYSDAPRILSQSLNTGNRQRIFAGLGKRMTDAQQMVIAVAFEETGLEVLNDQVLRCRGRNIQPDLVLYDRTSDYLLIVDYKNMINPLGPGQAISNMMNIRGYVGKMQEYIEVIEANLDVVRAEIPALSEHPQVSGMLLFRDPTPLPLDCEPRIAMANWFSLRQFLSGGRYDNLPSLVEWATARLDLGLDLGAYMLEDRVVKVGDWQYIREMHVRRD